MARGMRRVNRREGKAAVAHIHPWKVDPVQPVIKTAGNRGFSAHYLGLDCTEGKLRKLLGAFRFAPIRYRQDGCVRSWRARSQKSLAKGWRVWGSPDDVSVSGRPGAHAVMAWTKKDADGKTFAVIELYASGIFRSSGVRLLDIAETDHVTFCQFGSRGIAVPTQTGQPDAPVCCGTPYSKVPGERCTFRNALDPGLQCRGPR
jgi:Domain of unknown function (DUF3473)